MVLCGGRRRLLYRLLCRKDSHLLQEQEKAIKAEYIDHMGSDARVVDAARVSFSKIAENYSDDQNGKLIRYLAKLGHFTPFTHPQITLRETVPIFVARQRFKHTVGFTYNEVSRRYVDDEPEFYTPEIWRGRPEGGLKQGSSDEEITTFFWENVKVKADIKESYKEYIQYCENFYMSLIHSGIAPEQARMVLPQSMYTSYYVTGSLAAFARAFSLRSDGHAQLEIQELATQWDDIIRELFPVSWVYLTRSGDGL